MTPSATLDPPGPRWSCRYLESGLSFTPESVNACSITHHGRGEARLGAVLPAALPWEALEARRREIIRENQQGGHAACVDCPLLVLQHWPQRTYRYDWIGITHYAGCNLGCSYCWLQWADYSPRRTRQPVQTYRVAPFIERLIDERLLDPSAEIDWGGGGEPTLMPEFDACFARLHDYGTTQWLHTNAVSVPAALATIGEIGRRVRVVCSVDAGTAGTYRALKVSDRFERVWRNLARYQDLGAEVTVKYIMLPENCGDADISGFVARVCGLRRCTVVTDVDYRFPTPSPEILDGLLRLHAAAHEAGLNVRYGSTGEYSAADASTRELIRERTAPLRQAAVRRTQPLRVSLAHDLE
jgi:pyruvate-formate lyase-activating enzyme